METYSVDVPGATRDGKLHLIERKTSTEKSSSSGERATEQTIEQTNPGDSGSGLRVSVLVNGRTVPGPSGERSTVTVRARDLNGNLGIVSVDTTKSDKVATIQFQPYLPQRRDELRAIDLDRPFLSEVSGRNKPQSG